MAFVERAPAKTTPKQLVTMVFGDVRGVDFRSDDTASFRSPDSVNMYRSRLGYWETHVGFRQIGYIGKNEPILGLHKFTYRDGYGDIKTKVLIHAGSKMYTWDNYPEKFNEKDLTVIYGGLTNKRTKFLEFKNVLLIMDGEALYYYDGNVMDFVSHKAFVPQTWAVKTPNAMAGEEFQQRNYLSRFVIEGFAPDGTDTFYLSMTELDKDEVIVWEGIPNPDAPDNVFYVEGTDFTVDRDTGVITFTNIPASSSGIETLYIKYARGSNGYENRINECTEMIAYDDRVFVTGNPKYPNIVFWSQNEDWTYFGELNYNDKSGSSSAKVMALQLLQDNKFLSIKEDTHQDGSYAVWNQAALDNDYIAETYIASPAHSTIGCVSEFAHRVFMDDNVFLSANGLNAISRNLSISNERNIEHRSTLVDPKLLAEDLESAMVEQHRGNLYILFPNGHCYIANSAVRATDVGNNVEYEWAYAEGFGLLNNQTLVSPTQLVSFNDKELYFGVENGNLCKFYFDEESSDGAYPTWAYNFDGRYMGDYVDSPFSWFGVQNRFKKLTKKYNDLYCLVHNHTDVNVLFHTEKKFMDESKILPFEADLFSFNYLDFSSEEDEQGNTNYNFTFKTLPPVSFVLRKLKGKRFRRLQIRVKSGGINRPVIFKSLIVEAEVLTRKLK